MGFEVDFLPVGEGEKSGDAIALRYGDLFNNNENQTVVVIDGGTLDSGKQLVKHIRDYYGTNSVDYVISTHPDNDHISGLRVVLENMDVKYLLMHKPWEHSDEIKEFIVDRRVTENSTESRLQKSLQFASDLAEIAEEKGIPIHEPFAGLGPNDNSFVILGPTVEYYEEMVSQFREFKGMVRTSFGERVIDYFEKAMIKIEESMQIETLTNLGMTSAENNSSAVVLFNIDNRSLLFMADAGIKAISKALSYAYENEIDIMGVKLVQVPHHGSKRNIGPAILDYIVGEKNDSKEVDKKAVVSCSENGLPKHPSQKVINAFIRRGAKIYSTSGRAIWYHHYAPKRDGWSEANCLEFVSEFEDSEED